MSKIKDRDIIFFPDLIRYSPYRKVTLRKILICPLRFPPVDCYKATGISWKKDLITLCLLSRLWKYNAKAN